MCYSAMVEQSYRKISLMFRARVQIDLYEDIFARRARGEKILINRAMEEQFLDSTSSEETTIRENILAWRINETARLEKDLFLQKARGDKAEISLREKITKKAQEEVRISQAKIERIKKQLEAKKSPELSEMDSRIFPHHYFSLLVLNKDRIPTIIPVRYLLRPFGKEESFDRKYHGCYNARLDSLERVPWWKNLLGKKHGIMVVNRFYESVDAGEYAKTHSISKQLASKNSLELCFEPKGTSEMLIPVLWDYDGKSLYSAALITDDPAPEVKAAGHDRTPIFLQKAAAEDWIRTEFSSLDELTPILNRRETPFYEHRVVDNVA